MLPSRDPAPADEPLAELAKLAGAGWAVPDYVLAADPAAVAGGPGLPFGGYADPARRALPVHTKAAAWVSAARLTADPKCTGSPAAAGRVAHALAVFGADPPDPPPAVKAAADPACVFERGEFRACPVKTAADADRAADWLAEHRPATAYGERRDAARRLLLTPAAAGMSPAKRAAAERLAGWGFPDRAVLDRELRARAALAARPGLKAACRELVAAVAADPAVAAADPAALGKVAEALDAYDREAGLTHLYGTALRPPEAAVWPVAPAEAAAAVAALVVTKTGRAYARADLAGLDRATGEAVFGAAPAALPDLVAADGQAAVLWDKLAAERGVAPVAVPTRTPTRADLAAWAA